MNEAVSATTVTTTATTAAVAAPLFGIDPLVAIGAVTGAGIFIMYEQGHSKLKSVFLFFISVACGCLCASIAADLIATLLPGKINVSHGVGAILSSAVSVRVVQKVIFLTESQALQNLIKGKMK
ncbi:putative holin [Shewanella sp.]|uniref:putative holin n=1 Tax=Shewanella sp. TaxID=50422 RepID=UPI00356642AF